MRGILIGVLVFILLTALVGAVALAAGYNTPTTGLTPHSGYSSSSDLCEVCHAVHGAAGTPAQILLQSTKAGACNYCHITSTISSQSPYGHNTNNYTLNTRWNHSAKGYADLSNTDPWEADVKFSLAGTGVAATCVDCHSTHGASALPSNAFATTTIAKINPSGVPGADAGGGTAEEQRRSYCANCHRIDHFSTTYNGAAPNNYSGYSHVMNSNASASYGNPSASYTGIIAWINSNSCDYCHTVNYSSPPAQFGYRELNSFPHFVGGAKADVGTSGLVSTLAYGYFQILNIKYYGYNSGVLISTSGKKDVICLSCHRSGVNLGVGYTY